MNPHDQEKIDAIERDRRKREDELFLALLLLMDEARTDSLVMLKYHQSPATAIQTTLQLATGAISLAMADAYRDGVRRVAVMADEVVPQSGQALARWKDETAGSVQTLATVFRPQAQAATDAMIRTVGQSVSTTVTDFNAPVTELKRSLRDAFDTAGYSARKPFALNLATERAIVTAHNGGMFGGATKLQEKITGLRHVSVRDDHTTAICIERDGLMYPLDDPYWQENIPALHWNCRSAVLPIFEDFIPSERYPVTQPQPGFGYMSPVFLDRLKGLAA